MSLYLATSGRRLAKLIATFFGVGLVPMAPGTAGSLAALPLAYLIHAGAGHMGLLVAGVAVFFVGWWASAVYAASRGVEDPGEIVIDEVAGLWLLLSALKLTPESYLVGFLLFRFFDIVKPWPVSLADRRVKGGIGIMLDDMLAGFYPVFLFLLAYGITHASGRPDLLVPVVLWLGGHYS